MNSENDNIAKNAIPDEDEISELLSAIQPKPSLRFHQRMADQPWTQAKRQPLGFKVRAQRLATLAGSVFLLVLFLSLATPTLEAVAQRLMQFFLPTISDQTILQITLEETAGPTQNFLLTISEAENLAGFAVREPVSLPEGYTLSGAIYNPDRNAIVLNYLSEIPGQSLRILQRLLHEEYQQIGASAVVDIVQIGEVNGEYVTGAWTIPEVESAIEVTEFGQTAPLQATWDPEAEIQMLRWGENEMLFEIIFGGGNPNNPGYLTKSDLISLAESMH
ncbi:MAG: hypothetical protein H8D37_01355 [Chloroflexi bacterium]|nr:hypothetical protein [Chloroflexota bacterium]